MLLRRLLGRATSQAARLLLTDLPRSSASAHEPGNHLIRRLACLGLLAGAVGVGTAEAAEATSPPPGAEKGWHMLSLDQRRRVFFKYEKRIREMSPQEKVFDYFASQTDPAGNSYMLPGDMLRAVVPVYPPEGSTYVRSGSLAGEPKPEAPAEDSDFFRSFDINGDGCINFDEYMLFVTLLSIPAEDIAVAFKILDADSSGAVDAKEFGKLLEALKKRAARPTATLRHVGGGSQGGGQAGLLQRFFGADGGGQLSLNYFCSFLAALREELVRLEFQYYDYRGQGYMTGRDFAHSIVGCASPKYIEDYLNKVQAMPVDLADARVSLQDFKAFRAAWRQLRLLSVALEFIQNTSGVVTPEDFEWVAQNVLHARLTKQQVAVVFYLFGHPQRGLNVHYMHKVMSRHHATGLTIKYDYEQSQSPRSMLECIKECSAR